MTTPRLPRIPLSHSDFAAVRALSQATYQELAAAMLRAPTYQRTAVRELVRVLEVAPRSVPPEPNGDDHAG
jgi:hypothetical protein